MKNNNSTAITTISTPSFEDLKNLISEGNLNKIKILIDANPDLLNQADKYGKTALHFAAEDGCIEVVKYLIDKKGVDVNQADKHGKTAIHLAAQMGCIEIVKYLIKKGVDVNQANGNGEIALHFAAQRGCIEIVKYLIDEKKVDVNQGTLGYCETALHFAAQRDCIEIVKYLIKKGVDVNQPAKAGWTALDFAAHKGHTDVVNLITYYKKLYDLTAIEPSIDKPIEDSFMFRKNGETETFFTVDFFKKLLLKKYPDSASFEKYLNNLQSTKNKLSNPEVKEYIEKLYKIVCEFKEESTKKMDDIDLMLVQAEIFEGLKMTFTKIKEQHSNFFEIIETFKKLQSQISHIDSLNTLCQELEKAIKKEKLSSSVFAITDEVKKAIEFYIENPEYQTPGQFLIKMIEQDKDSLINALITDSTSKDLVLSLKNYILPLEIKKFIEELERQDSTDETESSKGFEVETANGDYEDFNEVERKPDEEDLESTSKKQKVEQENPSTSLEGSIDDHNAGEVASTNVVSSTGDVFTNIIGGVENLIIEDTHVVVMGDSGTEG